MHHSLLLIGLDFTREPRPPRTIAGTGQEAGEKAELHTCPTPSLAVTRATVLEILKKDSPKIPRYENFAE